jgi:site-specific DNA-adenine methylase
MSFGARYFTKYARGARGDTGDNTVHSGRLKKSTNIKRKTNIMKAVIECFSYADLPKLPPNSVIYCDPPYESTSKVHDFDSFDHDHFWDWCRDRVKEGHRVLVTEFKFPLDFVILHNFGDTVSRLGVKGHNPLDGKDSGVREVLVVHETQSHLWGLWEFEDKVNNTGETR